MPGSHPSNTPLAGSNNTNNDSNDEDHAHFNINHHANYNDNIMSIDSLLPTPTSPNILANNRPRDPGESSGARYRQSGIDFEARFSEFVRSTRLNASSDHPVIESYADNEDYQSLLAAISNIRMSRSQPYEYGSHTFSDELGHFHRDDMDALSTSHTLTHSPYPIQEDHIDDVRMTDIGEIAQDEFDGTANNTMDNLYDLQHIVIHNQREFENQMRQTREMYYHQRDSGHAEMEDSIASTRQDDHSTYEALNSPDASAYLMASEDAAQPVGTYSYSGSITAHPRPTISSSYFSPTTESTIVLSSPPPGRSSQLHSASQGDSIRTTNSIYSDAASWRHGNEPYRPFVTGRDLTMQQQHHEQQYNLLTSTDHIRSQGTDHPNNPLDAEGGRVFSGVSATGRWSAYGSVTRTSQSFEQHRYHYYLQQQHATVRRRRWNPIAEEAPGTPSPSPSVSDSLSPRLTLPLPQSHSGAIMHDAHSPISNWYHHSDGSGMPSNIPIPSRYINPQSSSHSHNHSTNSSTTDSRMFRPHNIITNYSRNGYRLSHEHESSEQPRRPHTSSAFQTYSTTVERAEAGGWDQPSLPLTADPSSFSWRGGSLNFRSRRNIGLKEVVRMACCFCETIICERGMKAQLLADQSVALLSTDDAPQSGNAIGYHITQPCEKCLSAENNGHLWLFHPEYIFSCPRRDPLFSRPLRWDELPTPDQDYETLSLGKVQQTGPGGKLIIGGMVRREYDAVCR
ncbi:Protein fam72a [Mortierella polycephala]|uniref:Protein fam72a n=1 Tax=Mortierella polycephala TaxID=41804 RepID=A0A9P6PPW1_9FUNG|nr:Protein fam72a [Mortierella polycephala]